MSMTPSGWYPNPHNAAEELYWDGSRWLGASRVRVVENAVETASGTRAAESVGYSSSLEDATVVRPAGGSWPAPTTYDPAWDTVPLTADGLSALAPAGHGAPYPSPGCAPYADAGYAAYPDAGYAQYPDDGYAQYPAGFAPYSSGYPAPATHPASGYGHQAVAPFPPPFEPTRVSSVRSNGFALAALLLGIGGFVLTAVPFLIGLVAGGIPDLLAILFGVLGVVRSGRVAGAGLVFAVVGIVLGMLGLGMIPLGAGWLW